MKEKLFIIFTDLDGTFLPLKEDVFDSLVEFIKNVQKHENTQVKFCPITGRSIEYTCNFLHEMNEKFAAKGLKHIVDFGAAEQGGVVVSRRKDGNNAKFIGNCEEEKLCIFKRIDSFIGNSEFDKYLMVEEGRICSSFIKVRDEAFALKTREEISEIFSDLKKSLVAEYGEKIIPTPYRYLFDVTVPGLSKDVAINYFLEKYQRAYNIVGFSFSGDAENDVKGFEYVSKIAEIPGIKAHVITPSNVRECVDCAKIEAWKLKILDSRSHIKISGKPLFEGVLEELNKKLADKTLIGPGSEITRAKDDLELINKKRRMDKDLLNCSYIR